MTKIAAALALTLLLALGSNWLMWRKLSASQDEAQRLRLSVQALEESAARSSLAMAKQRRLLATAESARVAAAQALERALAESPDWAAMPVPPGVQDAR